MPLLILSGLPSSGKSTVTQKIKQFFISDKMKPVIVICENDHLKKVNNSLL